MIDRSNALLGSLQSFLEEILGAIRFPQHRVATRTSFETASHSYEGNSKLKIMSLIFQ